MHRHRVCLGKRARWDTLTVIAQETKPRGKTERPGGIPQRWGRTLPYHRRRNKR